MIVLSLPQPSIPVLLPRARMEIIRKDAAALTAAGSHARARETSAKDNPFPNNLHAREGEERTTAPPPPEMSIFYLHRFCAHAENPLPRVTRRKFVSW